MNTSLRLSDLLARNVSVEWYEGVALVKDVVDRLLERPGSPRVPELHEVLLTADGQAVLTGGSKDDEPVRRLGQFLQAVLVQSEPPVQLRLVVSQATGLTPAYGSIPEFSQALSYFERPDRNAVLRALHSRAIAVPTLDGIPQPTLDLVAPLPDPQGRPAAPPKKSAKTNPRAQLAVVVTVVALVAIAVYLAFVNPSARNKVAGGATRAADLLGRATFAGLSTVSEKVGFGRLVPQNATAAPPSTAAVSAAAPSTPSASPALERADRSVETAHAKRAKASLIPVGGFARTPILPVPLMGFDLEPVAPLETVGRVTRDGSAEVPVSDQQRVEPDATVYTTGSAGVTAPIAIRPQLPKQLPAYIDKSKLGQIELVIMADGRVSSVKLLGWPNNVHEAMFLSAVKAWEFSPALKDGRPVAFRKTVWVAFQ